MPDTSASTVVVPCYQEASRLLVHDIVDFLARSEAVQLLFVDDGSTDGTIDVLHKIQATNPGRVAVMRLEQNSGKAEAVRQGVLSAMNSGADYVGYWDADLATPLELIPDFVSTLDRNPQLDVILGARVALLGRSIDRKWTRHYLGRVFATAASIAINLVVFDTQCGAKLIRVTPLTTAVFSSKFGSRWVFDVELLARYLMSGGSKRGLYEYPVSSWRDVDGSKVKPWDFFRATGELASIYRRYPLGQPLRAVVLPLTSMFSRYVVVGAAGTVLHYLTLVAAVEGTGMSAANAAALGALVGAVANYFMNYHFTFVSKASHRGALAKFLFVALLGALLSGLGVRWGVDLGLHYLVAQMSCTVIFLVLGFFLNRAWTF